NGNVYLAPISDPSAGATAFSVTAFSGGDWAQQWFFNGFSSHAGIAFDPTDGPELDFFGLGERTLNACHDYAINGAVSYYMSLDNSSPIGIGGNGVFVAYTSESFHTSMSIHSGQGLYNDFSIIVWDGDTGVSRLESGILGIGNGTSGDYTGALKLKSILLTDTAANTNLTVSNSTAATTAPATWAYYSTVVIHHTKVVSALTAFPVLIAGTYAQLATVANSGYVQNANGYDIIFSTTTSATNKIPHEVRSYNATTGAVIYHVQVPFLSTSADTTIYILYGNSSISTDQSNPTGVWDTNYTGVYHMDGASNAQVIDSTSNARSSTANSGQSTTGKWGNALQYTAASSQSTKLPAPWSSQSAFTFSGWIKVPNATKASLIVEGRQAGSFEGAIVYCNTTTGYPVMYVHGTVGLATATGTLNSEDNNWHYLAGTYDGATAIIYADASTPASNASTCTMNVWNTSFYVAEDLSGNYYSSSNMELRISNIARAAGWIQTEYQNQSSPSTFYTLGSATAMVVPVNASSPALALNGAYWNGSSSAADSWTIKNITAAAGSVLTLANTGGSTAPAVNVPALQIGGVSAGIALFNNGLDARFYPEAYGAVHTVGTDDSAAIQAAINAAASNGGGTVVLGPYTYYTSTTITVTASCVNLVGNCIFAKGTPAEGGSCLMNTTAGNDVLQITGTSPAPLVSNRVENIGLFRSVKPTGAACGLKWTYCLNTIATNVICQDNIYNFSFNHIVGSNDHIGCISYWTATSAGAGTCYGYWFDGYGCNSTDLTKCQSSQVSSKPVTHTALYLSGGVIADLYCDEFNTAFTSTSVYINAT